MSKIYIGIDNGLDGGICALRPDGKILSVCAMPTSKLGKGREIDRISILIFLAAGDCAVIVEQPESHAPSAAALRSLWYNFGRLQEIVASSGFPFHPVKCREWQGEFWKRPAMAKGRKFDTKAQAAATARRLWPEQDWTKSERSTKPHDGMIDAALIAEYARRKNL